MKGRSLNQGGGNRGRLKLKSRYGNRRFDSRSVCILQTDRTLEERLPGAQAEEQVEGEVSETIRGECRQVRWE